MKRAKPNHPLTGEDCSCEWTDETDASVVRRTTGQQCLFHYWEPEGAYTYYTVVTVEGM